MRKAVRVLIVAALLSTAACSDSDPSDAGAVPVRPSTTTIPPSTTQPPPTTVVAPTSTTRGAASTPSTTTTLPPRTPTTQALEPVWPRYTSATYKVSLAHPTSWQAPADGTASPPNFFSLNATSTAGGSLAETCRNAASHRLAPFGSSPAVFTDVTFAGQPACVIEPSADQPASERGMAQLMVRYPSPVQLPSGRYDVFVLTAHVRELSAIAASLSFLT